MTRSILITGCSSGIGADAARTLRDRGWRVFATCRRQDDCDHLAAGGFDSFVIDYEDPASIAAGAARAIELGGGRLDALFNNGAYAIPGAVEDLPPEALSAILQANLVGWHDLTRRVIPVMRAQGHGRIVNNSSVLGMIALKWRGAYVASKFALEGLTDTLRLEMRDAPIEVVLIEPGPIATRFRANAARQFERWIDWEGSVRAEQYRDTLRPRLHDAEAGSDRFELEASAVTAALIRALEARRPRARYFVTVPTHVMGAARRALPGRLLDALLARG